MKKAFTLIELIFSMVIIAIAFSVLPKVLYMASKNATTSLKEEAMYNAIAYAGLIRASAWDESNTEVDDILLVASDWNSEDDPYDCNTSTGYRIGGFVGSRNCLEDKNASALGSDGGDLDDIDDFASVSAKNSNSSRQYDVNATITYVGDTFFTTATSSSLTNSKRIKIIVYPKKKASELGNAFVQLNFTLYNLGQLRVNKRSWN